MKSITMRVVRGMINGVETKVSIPLYEHDKEIHDKINGDYQATIKQPRNMKHHNKFYGIMRVCIDNGILEHITKNIVHPFQNAISDHVINALRVQKKNDVDVLVYILKWLFLPMETQILPNGEHRSIVQSIAVSELDYQDFCKFYDESIQFCADVLGCDKLQLEMEAI